MNDKEAWFMAKSTESSLHVGPRDGGLFEMVC